MGAKLSANFAEAPAVVSARNIKSAIGKASRKAIGNIRRFIFGDMEGNYYVATLDFQEIVWPFVTSDFDEECRIAAEELTATAFAAVMGVTSSSPLSSSPYSATSAAPSATTTMVHIFEKQQQQHLLQQQINAAREQSCLSIVENDDDDDGDEDNNADDGVKHRRDKKHIANDDESQAQANLCLDCVLNGRSPLQILPNLQQRVVPVHELQSQSPQCATTAAAETTESHNNIKKSKRNQTNKRTKQVATNRFDPGENFLFPRQEIARR
jgi:hypothetical protein